METPHQCTLCLKFKRRFGVLGLPGQVEGVQVKMLKIARFDCPHECGIIDMTFEQIKEHVKDECDLRDFEKKRDIIDQCENL